MENPARVVFARDTRASGARLVGILNSALTASEVEFQDFKYLTTPQLHYIVRALNTLGTPYEYGEPTEQGYYVKLAEAFKRVMKNVKVQGSLTVDCANGVGGPKLRELIKYLPSPEEGGVEIKVVNDDVINPDRLNFEVRLGSKAKMVKIHADCSSAVPTSSRQSSARHRRPRPRRSIAVLRWTAMRTAWCTISWTKTVCSGYWTVTASRHWQRRSSATLRDMQVLRRSLRLV